MSIGTKTEICSINYKGLTKADFLNVTPPRNDLNLLGHTYPRHADWVEIYSRKLSDHDFAISRH